VFPTDPTPTEEDVMILVTGATGTVGGELVRQLTDAGEKVRALVRDPARAAAALPAGVELATGDLDRPDTLPAALAGADRIFLIETRYGTEQTGTAVAAARAAGVELIVNLSSIGVDDERQRAFSGWHGACEQVIRASGIPATFVRPGEFMSNALRWLPSIRATGTVPDPTGPGRTTPVDPADIAAVAALALTSGGLPEDPELTGGELLTVADKVRILSAALGRPITTVPCTPREAGDAVTAAGRPPEMGDRLAAMYTAIRAGHGEIHTDTIQRLLNRPPATFTDWCHRNAAAFT
jgi:uncharacterized protein YbjT (DUF2867 family)